MRLLRPGLSIDFVGQARVFGFLSLVAVTAALSLMFARTWNLGVDFKGGTVLQVQIPQEAGEVDEGRLREAMAQIEYEGRQGDVVIVRFGPHEDRAFLVNIPVSQQEVRDLSVIVFEGLSEQLGVDVIEQRIESIGPRVGEELRWAGIKALVVSWLLILLYIWFRFDLRYAPGAVLALIHDVVITAGVFVAFGFEFNLQVLAALLVVIGYSLNDTIVIYDRIRENLAERGTTHVEEVVNQSINQTLSRTLLTSLTTLTVVVTLLVLGGPVVRDFALALLIGVSVGTYSTIYVASALLIFLERRFAPAPGRA